MNFKNTAKLFYTILEFTIFSFILFSGFISPKVSILFSFLSFLVFPAMLLILFLAVWAFILKQKKSFFYLLLFIGFTVLYGDRLFQISFNKDVKDDSTLKVLSYNVGRFKQGVDPADLPAQLEAFYAFLEQEEVDIICFQEFSFVTRNIQNDLTDLGYQDVMFKDPKVSYRNIRENFFVKSIFFESAVITNEKDTDIGVKTKILFGQDTLLLLNTHIKSYNVKSKHPLKQNSLKESIRSLFDILNSIRNYVFDQAEQIDMICKIAETDEKVIFCGDFNSMPSSYVYTRVSRILENAFESAGNGFGFTYLGKTLFFLRIDSQFYREQQLECIKFSEIDFGFSDHKATLGEYRFKSEN